MKPSEAAMQKFERDRLELLDCAGRLDSCLGQARSFRALIDDLRTRPSEVVPEAQGNALHAVRAGLHRSLIGLVMSALDSRGRGDRASLGHVVALLEKPGFVAYVDVVGGSTRRTNPDILSQIPGEYRVLVSSEPYKVVRELRDFEIAHVMRIPSDAVQQGSTADLHDAAERLVVKLHEGAGFSAPNFLGSRSGREGEAARFWDATFYGFQHSRKGVG